MQRPTPPRPPDLLKPIGKLPPSASSLLRSTVIVPSIQSCLVELVQNALDAQSSKIEVHVDLDTWTIRCQDDGTGMLPTTLEALSSGERYWTTKDTLSSAGNETFGFRGEALASLAAVGLLEIHTKTADAPTHSLVLRGGEKLYHGKAAMERAAGRGTSVWTRDLFYKWPVRRKQYSSLSAQSKLLISLRHTLSKLSLLQPRVSIYLTSGSSSSKLLAFPKSNDGILGRWRQLWGSAGVESVWPFSIVEATPRSSSTALRADGFFSLGATHTKSTQFIYVNARPLSPGALHKAVNAQFRASSFARHATSQLISGESISPITGRTRSRKSATKAKSSMTERYPVFVLNLTGEHIDVTLGSEREVVGFEDQKRVHDLVHNVVDQFLRGQGYISGPGPSNDRDNTGDGVASPEFPVTDGMPTLAPLPPFDDGAETQHRNHRTHVQSLHEKFTCARKRTSGFEATSSAPKRYKACGPDQRQDILPHGNTSAEVDHSVPPEDGEPPAVEVSQLQEGTVRWMDPMSKKSFLIGARTGNSVLNSARVLRGGNTGAASSRLESRSRLVDRTALSGVQSRKEETPVWLSKTIRSWTNPVFPSSKPGVKSLTKSTNDRDDLVQCTVPARPLRSLSGAPAVLTASRVAAMSSYFDKCGILQPHSCLNGLVPGVPAQVLSDLQRYSSASLRSATFIAQLDRKFLLVRMHSNTHDITETLNAGGTCDTLVVIDQHAASERVRVERYLTQTCGAVARGGVVETLEFDEPVNVLVSREEARVIRDQLDEFATWGIPLRLDSVGEVDAESYDDPQTANYSQVKLLGIPRLVADRVRADASVQQDLVRTFATHLADKPRRTRPRDRGQQLSGSHAVSWQSMVPHAPPVLIDLINSKACRGAIMFNDELSPDQSRRLLSKLADATFPFQCAHGRPSLYPLVNLLSSSSVHRQDAQSPKDSSSTTTSTQRRDVNWFKFAPDANSQRRA